MAARRIVLGVVVAATLALTGCSGSGSTAGPPSSSATVASATTTTLPPTTTTSTVPEVSTRDPFDPVG